MFLMKILETIYILNNNIVTAQDWKPWTLKPNPHARKLIPSNTREGVWELQWHAWYDGYTNSYPIPLIEELRSRVTWSGCKPHLLLTEEDMGSWANIGRSFLTLWCAMVSPIHHNWEDGDKDPVESIIAASQADIGAGDNRHSKHCPTIREWFSIRVF
jgi:hypothetical protein